MKRLNEVSTLSKDINRIEIEIDFYKQQAGQSIWEIGRRLNHVKEKDLAHGEFMDWLEKVQIEHTSAKRMMKIANELPKSATLHHLGESALYLIATLPEEDREKEHDLSNGETKSVDEMTVRELQEVKRKNKELEQQLEQEKNKPPKEKITEVEKEVEHPHVEDLRSDNRQLSQALRETQQQIEDIKKRNDFIEKQYQDVLKREEQDRADAEHLKKLKQELEELATKKDKYAKEVTSIKNFIKFKSDVEELLIKITPTYYLDEREAIQQNETLQRNYEDLINKVQKWCDDMYQKLGKTKILEGEFTQYDE
jgi:uncharacterized phage infection (PIP) family protein YhgE